MSGSKKAKTVLMVESNRNFCRLMVHELRRRELAVELVANGRAVVSKCLAQPPDVIVVDLSSSNFRQLSFIGTIRRQYSAIPIVVVSLFSSSGAISRALAIEVGEFLEKPCPLELIGERVERWFRAVESGAQQDSTDWPAVLRDFD